MRKTVYETMFSKMQQIGIIDAAGTPATIDGYLKLENDPYMPLSVDWLPSEKEGTHRISMAHNHILNGDVMADPDMEIRIYPDLRAAEALSYQQDGLGIYQVVFPEPGQVYPKVKKELNTFLNRWLSNLIDQGFKVET